MFTFIFRVGSIRPKSVKCSHSATKAQRERLSNTKHSRDRRSFRPWSLWLLELLETLRGSRIPESLIILIIILILIIIIMQLHVPDVRKPRTVNTHWLELSVSDGFRRGRVQCYTKVCGSFRKLGAPYFGVLIIRILLFRVLYLGPLFSETPMLKTNHRSDFSHPRLLGS